MLQSTQPQAKLDDSAEAIKIGDIAIPYVLVEKPWIRNTYMKFDDEKLIVTARNFNSAQKIVNQHKDWITKHYSQISKSVRMFGNNTILFNGSNFEALYVPYSGRTRLEIGQNRVSVYAKSTELAERAIDKWLALQTKLFTEPPAMEKARSIGKNPTVAARRCGKWGFCKSNNTITFNSYLCMLPADLRDYIVSHEVAHLKQMNHSARFWDVVSGLCPNYKEMRKKLRNYDSKRRKVYAPASLA